MEQTTQQITQNPLLPIKTKIAAWWMIISGGIIILIGIWIVLEEFSKLPEGVAPLGIVYTIPFGLLALFLPSLFLLKRRRAGWYWSEILLPLALFFYHFFSFFITWPILYFFLDFFLAPLNLPREREIQIYQIRHPLFLIILLFPFVLLLLDRKNFFKITR